MLKKKIKKILLIRRLKTTKLNESNKKIKKIFKKERFFRVKNMKIIKMKTFYGILLYSVITLYKKSRLIKKAYNCCNKYSFRINKKKKETRR